MTPELFSKYSKNKEYIFFEPVLINEISYINSKFWEQKFGSRGYFQVKIGDEPIQAISVFRENNTSSFYINEFKLREMTARKYNLDYHHKIADDYYGHIGVIFNKVNCSIFLGKTEILQGLLCGRGRGIAAPQYYLEEIKWLEDHLSPNFRNERVKYLHKKLQKYATVQ